MKLLSIIIPTLNESKDLPKTIATLRKNSKQTIPKEIIVVDTGSTDNTLEIAKSLDLKTISFIPSERGRALALNRGAREAKGEVLLFLDADTLLPESYDVEIKKALHSSTVVGGAFEFALNGRKWSLRIVEWVNRIRYRVRQRFYGDQGIFVRKNTFEKIGGYPALKLMEAAHFCRKLRKVGKLKLIKKPALSSPRRFLEKGVFRMLFHDIKIWWVDFCGRPAEKFASEYWEKNQKKVFLPFFLMGLFVFHSGFVTEDVGWKLRKDEEGIQVYQRPMLGSNIHEVKGIAYADVSLDQVIAFYEDESRYSEWCYGCDGVKVIKHFNPMEKLVYYGLPLPWPVKDRDSVSIHKKVVLPKAKTVSYEISNAPEAYPPQKGKLRIQELEGVWRFRALSDQQTEIYYWQHVDVGGHLPKWLVNRLAVQIPYQSIRNLREFVENPAT